MRARQLLIPFLIVLGVIGIGIMSSRSQPSPTPLNPLNPLRGGSVPGFKVPLPEGGVSGKLPTNLPSASKGPFLNLDSVRKIALTTATKGYSSPNSIIKDIKLSTHGTLIDNKVFSRSFSVDDSREVYLVTRTGNFFFSRVPNEPEFDSYRRRSFINMEIDATNGDVLAIGGSNLTQNPEIIKSLPGLTL
ncbi:MAG: hypothetical protein V7K72_24335 [Nostoc sp.]|uniref:hypothetical protein n=1 Tax=Nostoc sp. TaxID=1180 RepID=UPI002FF685C7